MADSQPGTVRHPDTIAVVGVGSIGGFFAAQAARAGHDPTLCVRRPFDRLVLESEGETSISECRVITEVDAATAVRWVILATKTYQVPTAVDWFQALCGSETTVVVLQNGIEQVERVQPLVPTGTEVLPAVVHCGTETVAPGHVVHHTNGHAFLPDGPSSAAFASLFSHRDGTIRLARDWQTKAWEKLVTNSVLNPITALSGQPIGVIHDREISELAQGVIRESIAVARADGAHLPEGFAQDTLERMRAFPRDIGTSMSIDRAAGRPLEIDAINGAVVRRGRRHGIPTPLNQALAALLGAGNGA